MKRQIYRTILASAVILPLLVSCKGRTTSTVEPDGDTVEVVINDEEYPDSIIIPDNLSDTQVRMTDREFLDIIDKKPKK